MIFKLFFFWSEKLAPGSVNPCILPIKRKNKATKTRKKLLLFFFPPIWRMREINVNKK